LTEEELQHQRETMLLATNYANLTHETEQFVQFYNSMDPKAYEDCMTIVEFSDEQEAMAKVVY